MRGMIIDDLQALLNLYGSVGNSLNVIYGLKYNDINLYRLGDAELLYLYKDVILKCARH